VSQYHRPRWFPHNGGCHFGKRRYGPGFLGAFGNAAPLIVGEEEKLVFEDGTTNVATEDVADELAGAIGQATAEFGLLIEIVVGDSESGTVVPIGGTMEVVCPGLGDEADLCAGGMSGLGVGHASGDAKLLDRVLGLAKNAGEGETVDLIVIVDTIDRDVALIGTTTIDCATTAILLGGIARWRQINDSGLEREDVWHVARLAGERLDSRVVR
jgi:hypothetical protein